MKWRFNCSRHAYESPEKRYLIAAISVLAKNGDIPGEIFFQMNKILLEDS